MVQFYDILEELHLSSTECVLATIIHVKGSAYMGVGTSMLIKQDGTYIGILSGGCLEDDVILRSRRVFESKKSETLVYMGTDLEWGVESGCHGTLYILLEFVEENLKRKLLDMRNQLSQGNVIIQQRRLNKNWELVASDFFKEEHFRKSIHESIKDHYIYTQRITPKPRLVIFGAGVDVQPVVSLAAQAGFSVTVCDWRPALCNEESIPGADQYFIGFPNDVGQRLFFKKEDYVIIMTHNLQRDREVLALVMNKPLCYIGILGSKKRAELLFDTEIPNRIHVPIGLNISAKGPYEIAVSIVAELIHVRNGQRPI